MNAFFCGRTGCKTWSYRLGIALLRLRRSLYFYLVGSRYRRKKEKYKMKYADSTGNFETVLPQGCLLVYARGVGEVQASLPLLHEAKKSNFASRVLAVYSPEGRAMAETLARDLVDAVIYAPWEGPRFVRRTLDRLLPAACLVVDLEPSPVPILLNELRRRKIPSFLVNASMPKERKKDWGTRNAFWSGVLDCFEIIMLRSPAEKEKLMQMGLSGNKLVVTGNCKVDALAVRKENMDFSRWRRLRADGPVLLAGSTHLGENEVVLEAFERVRERIPAARLILAPRFLRDVEPIARLSRRHKTIFISGLMTAEAELCAEIGRWDILIVDIIGVLFELYSIADAAFVGGSLVSEGGHNLMEPAVFGIPVTHGPYMEDFPEAAEMDGLEVSREVRDAAELAEAWLDALNPTSRSHTDAACGRWFASVGGAAARSWTLVEKCLQQRIP